MLGFAVKGMGANGECWDYAAHHAFFLKFSSGLDFLNICFVITSCTKSLSEQTKAPRRIHTFNHCAKDSKKAKQLLTEML